MTMGGIAHGIGAALFEEFAYNEDGQLIAQSSWITCCRPRTRCRRSNHRPRDALAAHRARPEGHRQSGYIGAPAAIANAINDALRPLGVSINTLPLKVSKLGDLIAQAREESAA